MCRLSSGLDFLVDKKLGHKVSSIGTGIVIDDSLSAICLDHPIFDMFLEEGFLDFDKHNLSFLEELPEGNTIKLHDHHRHPLELCYFVATILNAGLLAFSAILLPDILMTLYTYDGSVFKLC